MRILALIDYFEPGYKAGGPIRTLRNMIDGLGDDFEFYVVTRDRDLGASEAYSGIAINCWVRMGKAKVFYIPPVGHLMSLWRLLRNPCCDILYLNSFFSWKSSIFPLFLLRCGLIKKIPVVLAPRGEFSRGALGLKGWKKCLYITLAKILGIYQHVIWQASSENESEDIRQIMGARDEKVVVAPNLLPVAKILNEEEKKNVIINDRHSIFRTVFLSRISPMKNLDFLLRALQRIDDSLILDIYGPIEDSRYWDICYKIIKKLPDNISVNYKGSVPSDQVAGIFGEYDLFIFPTRGENFGHVIFESLSAGTPVLISDQTPWVMDDAGAIEVLSLDDEMSWTATISNRAKDSIEARAVLGQAARSYAMHVRENEMVLLKNRELFNVAAESGI